MLLIEKETVSPEIIITTITKQHTARKNIRFSNVWCWRSFAALVRAILITIIEKINFCIDNDCLSEHRIDLLWVVYSLRASETFIILG